MAINRQQLDLNIRENSIRIRQGFLGDKSFLQSYLSEPGERKDFIAANHSSGIGDAIKQKTDSILQRAGSPLSSTIYTITGPYCYLMDYVPPDARNADMDHAQYKTKANLSLCMVVWVVMRV